MIQKVYDGTLGNDYLDASAEGAKDIAVFRAAAGSDTCIGGAGADRFDGGAGANLMFGGGGNDAFFIARDNATGGARDSIDGGTGTDLLNIAMGAYQVTDAMKAEIARLDTYLHGDTTQHFVSDLFHVDMVNVETATIRLDGVIKTLAAVAGPTPVTIGFEGADPGNGNVSDPFTISESGFVFAVDFGDVFDAVNVIANGLDLSANGGAVLSTYGYGSFFTSITRADNGVFALDSVMDRGWNAGDTGTIQGFHAGTKIYELTVSSTSWHTDTLNWTGLDQVKVVSDGYSQVVTDGWVFH